jgi:hypothetical protein
MSGTWRQLLSRMECNGPSGTLRRVKDFIRINGLETIRSKPAVHSVSETLGIWSVRAKNSRMTGVSIPGARALVQNLKALPADSEVEQFSFTGEELAGSLFFSRKTREFLGDTIIQRRPKNGEMLDLQAELLEPTRKSA